MPKTPAKPAPAKAPRQRKTDEQRATEALEVAKRRVTKAEERVTALKAELEAAAKEHADATARRDYLAQDPALPAEPESFGDDVLQETD